MNIQLSHAALGELRRFAVQVQDGKELDFRLPANDFSAAYELQEAGLINFDVNADANGMMGPTEEGKVQIRALALTDDSFK